MVMTSLLAITAAQSTPGTGGA